MAETPFKYRAFISYAHADEKWARWLHKSLETYRIPRRLVGLKTEFGPVPAKLAPVFRDRDELASATDLGEKLTSALQGAASLVVICSKASAQSHWVNEEILAYKRLGRSQRIFSLIVDGEPYSTGIPGEEENECFPAALRFQLGADGELSDVQAEPIAADARPGKDGKSNARVKLIAGILGVGFDDLKQRELQRRNRRLAFISVSAVAGMLFAIGLATTAVIARNEAQQQRERAEREAATAQQTANFMVDLFAVSDPGEARGRSITAREILAKGAERIRSELSSQPRVQTTLMDTIGKVYTNLGLYDDASELLEDAVELRGRLPGLTAEENAQSLLNLANVVTEKADYPYAASLYRRALAELEAAGRGDIPLHIDILAALAELHFREGKFEEAEPLLRGVLDERLQRYGREDASVADAIEELGLNQFDQGRLPEAESLLRESLELRWQLLGRSEPHPDLAENISNLALILGTQGNVREAGALYEQALEMNRALYKGPHPLVALTMSNLAHTEAQQGKLDLAEQLFVEAIAMQVELLGDSHPAVAQSQDNLALVYYERGDFAQAIDAAGDALAIQRKALGENHPETAYTLRLLGRFNFSAGNVDQAVTLLQKSLALQESLLGAGHPSTAVTRMELARALLGQERVEEALAQAARAEDDLRSAFTAEHELTARAMGVHGLALLAQRDYAAAERLFLASYDYVASRPGTAPADREEAQGHLQQLYLEWGKPERLQNLEKQPPATIQATR